MRVLIGIHSSATVANRKGILHATARKIHAIINHALNKEEGPKPMIITNRKSLYRQLAPSRTIALRKNELTKYWAIWQIKTKRSKTSLSKSSGMEGIFRTPEPDGLGEGFTL